MSVLILVSTPISAFLLAIVLVAEWVVNFLYYKVYLNARYYFIMSPSVVIFMFNHSVILSSL